MGYSTFGNGSGSATTKSGNNEDAFKVYGSSFIEVSNIYTSVKDDEPQKIKVKEKSYDKKKRKEDAKIGKRAALNVLYTEGHAILEKIQGAIDQVDRIDLRIDLVRFEEKLSDLWKMRSVREPDWGDLLTLFHGSLVQLKYEELSRDAFNVIYDVYKSYLGPGLVDEQMMEEALSSIKKLGIDPFRPMFVEE